MANNLMSGLWRLMIGVPPSLWEKEIAKVAAKAKERVGAMSREQRAVHLHVVRQLPRQARPLPPESIAQDLGLPVAQVREILVDLERGMTFLFCNHKGEVLWAYPVTVEQTPHRVTFSSGERLYAAWAIDALATPFVQGRLRNQKLAVSVDTQCAHCSRPMRLNIDQDMNCLPDDPGCRPIIFVPRVEVSKLKEPSIIDSFWRESVFFWSEEHAREFRRQRHRLRGGYFTVDQAAQVNRLVQSALFGF